MNTLNKGKVGRPAKGYLEEDMGIASMSMGEEFEPSEGPINRAVVDTESVAPVRRSMRDASMRAEELRARMRDQEGGRDFHDDFYIDPREIPEGWVYNWKRHSTAGMEDETYAVELHQVGWQPVPVERHPHLMPQGSRGAIIRQGMILMEIPEEFANELRQRDFTNAREAVEAKENALRAHQHGTFEKDKRVTGIRKSFSPMMVPTS